MKRIAPCALVLLLAGCATEGPLIATAPKPAAAVEPKPDAAAAATPEAPAPAVAAAVPAVTAPPPPPTARTVEEFDTTTPAERAAAVAPPPTPEPTVTAEAPAAAATPTEGRLGTTVASLGSAGEPGFWIKTPLVTERRAGRLYYAASGRNVQVQLIPTGGSSGSGSQVSLAAMRLLDAPLDGLPEIVVYSN